MYNFSRVGYTTNTNLKNKIKMIGRKSMNRHKKILKLEIHENPAAVHTHTHTYKWFK